MSEQTTQDDVDVTALPDLPPSTPAIEQARRAARRL